MALTDVELIVWCRMASARTKAEAAQMAAIKAHSDAEKARVKAREYDPNFLQPGRLYFLSDKLGLLVVNRGWCSARRIAVINYQ